MRTLDLAVLVPDADAVSTFLDVVFGHTTGFVAVRLLTEKGTPSDKPWTSYLGVGSSLASDILRDAQRAASRKRGVFVVPGTVYTRGSAKARDIMEIAVVLVDIDNGDVALKRDHLERHLGPATLVVASGGVTDKGQDKLHLYWRLCEAATGADLLRVCALRATIAQKVGGDPSFASPHQPIRVPGTVHGKFGQQTMARIIRHSLVELDLEALSVAVNTMSMLEGQGETSRSSETPAAPVRATDLMTRMVGEHGQDGITRFDAVSKVIGHWLRQVRRGCVTLDEARQAVEDHNEAMIRPPWPVDRLRREFAGLLRHDIDQHGPLPKMATIHGKPTYGESTYREHLSYNSAPPLSEDALAAKFVASMGEDWRHVAIWGRWMRWSGTHWSRDEMAGIRDAIRLVCRRASSSAGSPTEARRIASARTIGAVERIASSDPDVAASPSVWDTSPMLLNTPGGIVDLATGVLKPHLRQTMMTQIAGAVPGQSCPRWLTFLDEITGGNRDLVAYLARLCGYCLTGSTREQVFFFLHGQGANGKSVFLQVLASILGTYAATSALDTFMASSYERHSTDLAGLRGTRLVTVAETEAGRAWAESRIKTITGGDPIRARFMHQDFFEFTPTFKLIVAGNHRPHLHGVGEAMRRRLHLVPFEVTIPGARRDLNLLDKLKNEREGILGWMLAGCVEWQRIGLCPPKTIYDAVTDYIADEDMVGQWIAAHGMTSPSARTASIALYESWCRFAESAGIAKGSQKEIAERGSQTKGVHTGQICCLAWLGWNCTADKGGRNTLNPYPASMMKPLERRAELCTILARGLVRLHMREITELSDKDGEFPLHYQPVQCRHAIPTLRRNA